MNLESLFSDAPLSISVTAAAPASKAKQPPIIPPEPPELPVTGRLDREDNAILTPQMVSQQVIEHIAPPEKRTSLQGIFNRTVQAYRFLSDADYAGHIGLSYLDSELTALSGQRIALDGHCDDGGTFRITSWRLIPSDAPPEAAAPPVRAPAEPAKQSGVLPGMERRRA